MSPMLTVAVICFLVGGLAGMFVMAALNLSKDAEIIAEKGE